MKEYTTEKLRNVAFVGHQSSGKTSLVEALLYNTGAINRLGKIEEKNTVSDWEEDAKERGLSLSTSLVPVEFDDTKINILDAPGYTDFQGEVKNAIRVADSVLVVVDAVSGVEVGTELAWQYAEAYQQPIIVTINKMDRENANFESTLESLRTHFPEYKFIPVMIPIGAEASFKGVVNLLTMKAYYDAGADRSEMPPEMEDIAHDARIVLVEAAAEADDKLIEKYFAESDLTSDEIRDGMRKAARDAYLKTVPVFVTSGTKNIGTVPLLEAMVVYVSPPLDRRVRHVLTENARVDDAVAALAAGDLPRLGQLLDASHASLRDVFEVSTPAVEATRERMLAAGAAGARIVGGDFGGSVLGLFPPGAAPPPEALAARPGLPARLLDT